MTIETPAASEQPPADAEPTQDAPPEGADGQVQLEPEPEADKFDPDRALEKIRKLNSENRSLREAKKAAEEKAASVDEKDQRIQALEAENLRIRIGARHGLPDELIDRLRGDSEEEILADAEKLLSLVARKAPPTAKPTERLAGGGDPTVEPEEKDLDKLAGRMFNR